MPEWQPIATAPKDREIMLFCPRYGVWAPGEWRQTYWTHFGELLFGVRVMKANQPTHWMPLPAPPTGA